MLVELVLSADQPETVHVDVQDVLVFVQRRKSRDKFPIALAPVQLVEVGAMVSDAGVFFGEKLVGLLDGASDGLGFFDEGDGVGVVADFDKYFVAVPEGEGGLADVADEALLGAEGFDGFGRVHGRLVWLAQSIIFDDNSM